MPSGIYDISGVLIRGEGMDRNGMKKYIQFSSQNSLVTKSCHRAPFSSTRTLSPPILWEERTEKIWKFQILTDVKVIWALDKDNGLTWQGKI